MHVLLSQFHPLQSVSRVPHSTRPLWNDSMGINSSRSSQKVIAAMQQKKMSTKVFPVIKTEKSAKDFLMLVTDFLVTNFLVTGYTLAPNLNHEKQLDCQPQLYQQ